MAARIMLSLIFVLLSLVCFVTATSSQQDQLSNKDLQLEEASLPINRAQTKYVASTPNGLTRFLFYRPNMMDRQASALGGYKRSSSALDALTGVTLGKRSSGSLELVNMEPVLGRQYNLRSSPRMYDLRWAPLDAFDGPALSQDSY